MEQTDLSAVKRRIEELRRELYQAMGGRYDPARVQLARSISYELDRLVVTVTRADLDALPPAPARGATPRRGRRRRR